MDQKPEPSKTENNLYNELKKMGLKPEKQLKIDKTHVDIAFPYVKLLIEVDGPHHDSHEQIQNDRRRNIFHEKKGWKIKRYSANEVYENTKVIAQEINNDILKLLRKNNIDWNPETITNIKKNLDPETKKLLSLVDSNKKPMLITGKAGTGKSTLLKIISSTKKNAVVLAPTGLAAINIEGQTIHSFFKLKPGIVSEEEIANSANNLKLRILCRNIDYLIIDEISMVRADMFDAIDNILRSTRNNNKPFGGVKLILFGDLYQLPPIVDEKKEKRILQINYGYKIFYFFGSKVFKKMDLEIENLTKVYRQKDLDFINILDKVRTGNITQKTIDKFKERVTKYPDKLVPPPLVLTSTKSNVANYNKEHLDEIKERSFLYIAKIEGTIKPDEIPVDVNLELKKGARIVLLQNKKGKFVNGDLGTVVNCGTQYILVRLDRTGKIEYVNKELWTKYEFRYDEKIGKIRKWTSGKVTQFPLKLAWAMTIHKSQGLTLNNIYVDTTSGIWAEGQLYVALSRCKKFEGLYLAEAPQYSYFKKNYDVNTFLKERGIN